MERAITEEDIGRLTEIRIKRISKYDTFQAEEKIKELENGIAELNEKLENLTEYCIDHFRHLKKKYGKGMDRKSEIRQFESIEASKVTVANKKLYVNRKEGFIGYGMRREGEYVRDCSDIDNIIVFRNDGTMLVTQVDSKKFVGKDIRHVSVWKKGDERTIFHMVYVDGKDGPARLKRFNVPRVTRDREYDLTKGKKGSRVLYFSENPNGRTETLEVTLKPKPRLKKLKFQVEVGEYAIKSRGSQGNIITKHAVSKIEQKEVGSSTLDARKIWFDPSVFRLNTEERGEYLGEFGGKDRILTITRSGNYQLLDHDLNTHFDEDTLHIEKWDPNRVLSMIHYDGEKKEYRVKRFYAEEVAKKTPVVTDHEDSRVVFITSEPGPKVEVKYDGRSSDQGSESIELEERVDPKGLKAKGNLLTREPIRKVELIDHREEEPGSRAESEEEGNEEEEEQMKEQGGTSQDSNGSHDEGGEEQMRLDLGPE